MRKDGFWKWLAGFAEGEGTFGLQKRKNKMAKNGFQWGPYFILTNPKENIEFIDSHTKSGSIGEQNSKECNVRIYNLRYSGQNVKEIVSNILPYLISKRKQAELVLEAVNILEDIKTTEENQRLEEIMRELAESHNKGRKPSFE